MRTSTTPPSPTYTLISSWKKDAKARTITNREPILKKKGWSLGDWAVNSNVDRHTVDDYLKGQTKSYLSTRKKLADALGVSVEELP